MQFDNIMKKLILFAALSVATMCFAASAANARVSDPVLYRSTGYKGSVSLTDITLAWVGLETSHGYMFNEHHYLGAGAGAFTVPAADTPFFAHAFVEYRAYILKKNSTPVAGIKAGWFGSTEQDASGNLFANAFELEPNVGWTWAFNEKLGMNLCIGATSCLYSNAPGSLAVLFMPKLTIGLEF